MIEARVYNQVLTRIREKSESSDLFIIAIDGNSSAGKSTLGQRLALDLKANLYQMDDFFLRPEQRTPERLEEVGGNVDYERFEKEVLAQILTNQDFSYRPYDCQIGDFLAPKFFKPNKIHIVEGSYSQHPLFADSYDFRIFIKTDYKMQKKRILERNGQFLYQRFIDEWIPKENAYFSAFGTEKRADFIIKT